MWAIFKLKHGCVYSPESWTIEQNGRRDIHVGRVPGGARYVVDVLVAEIKKPGGGTWTDAFNQLKRYCHHTTNATGTSFYGFIAIGYKIQFYCVWPFENEITGAPDAKL